MGNFGSGPTVQTNETAKSGANFIKTQKRLSSFNYSHRLDRKRLQAIETNTKRDIQK